MAKLDQVYLDTCAWLALINKEPKRYAELSTIYKMGEKTQIEIWTSTLTVVEAFRLREEEHATKPYDVKPLAEINDVLMQDFIKLVPVDVEVALSARRFRRTLSTFSKCNDAVHLSAAHVWNMDYLVTYDGSDLLKMDQKIDRTDGTKLRIILPSDYLMQSTFGSSVQPPSAGR